MSALALTSSAHSRNALSQAVPIGSSSSWAASTCDARRANGRPRLRQGTPRKSLLNSSSKFHYGNAVGKRPRCLEHAIACADALKVELDGVLANDTKASEAQEPSFDGYVRCLGHVAILPDSAAHDTGREPRGPWHDSAPGWGRCDAFADCAGQSRRDHAWPCDWGGLLSLTDSK
ncbi:hypothetical protein, partial [Aeromicrobium sp.]|uniref:hypothetical protein n=1 Tax=Aeromicrobium sp. TaxID=1871063 RepID=UPI002FC624A1